MSSRRGCRRGLGDRVSRGRAPLALVVALSRSVSYEWGQIGRPVRLFCGSSIISGIIFLFLFTPADLTGFWNDHPYLSNLASNVTGALFGIPIAIVLLSRINARYSESLDEKKTKKLLLLAIDGFDELVHSVLPQQEAGRRAADQPTFDLVANYRSMEMRLLQLESQDLEFTDARRYSADEDSSIALLREYLGDRQKLALRLHNTTSFEFAAKMQWWSEVGDRWTFLVQQLRYQCMLNSVDWPLSIVEESSIGKLMHLSLDLRTIVEIADEGYAMPVQHCEVLTSDMVEGKELNDLVARIRRDTPAQHAHDELILLLLLAERSENMVISVSASFMSEEVRWDRMRRGRAGDNWVFPPLQLRTTEDWGLGEPSTEDEEIKDTYTRQLRRPGPHADDAIRRWRIDLL